MRPTGWCVPVVLPDAGQEAVEVSAGEAPVDARVVRCVCSRVSVSAVVTRHQRRGLSTAAAQDGVSRPRGKLVLALCSLGAAGGGRWLLTTVRGHFGAPRETGDPSLVRRLPGTRAEDFFCEPGCARAVGPRARGDNYQCFAHPSLTLFSATRATMSQMSTCRFRAS